MAVSVPPPLFHLNSISKFREESSTLKEPSTTASVGPASTPKNKRKSQEPKRVCSETSFPVKRFKVFNDFEDDDLAAGNFQNKSTLPVIGSDGEQSHSPCGSSNSSAGQPMSPLSSSSSFGMCSAPPKKRFKAHNYVEEEEAEVKPQVAASPPRNPFRPWDDAAGSAAVTIKTESPPATPFTFNPLAAFPYAAQLLAASGGLPASLSGATSASHFLSPDLSNVSPAISSLLLGNRLVAPPALFLPTVPVIGANTATASATPSRLPSSIASPPKIISPPSEVRPPPASVHSKPNNPTAAPSRDWRPSSSSQFDAETCQVLSRLYPYLLKRHSTATDEPEQDEPLALVKPKSGDVGGKTSSFSNDDDDDVFVKREDETGSPHGSGDGSSSGKAKQRNYKNMTRERRIEANARERQRVHTITAAFDRLQSAIPTAAEESASNNSSSSSGGANSSGSKLSKLSIIKIATSYIMLLSRMAGYDYSKDQSAPSVEDCIKACADLVKAEAKSRKKSSDSSE